MRRILQAGQIRTHVTGVECLCVTVVCHCQTYQILPSAAMPWEIPILHDLPSIPSILKTHNSNGHAGLTATVVTTGPFVSWLYNTKQTFCLAFPYVRLWRVLRQIYNRKSIYNWSLAYIMGLIHESFFLCVLVFSEATLNSVKDKAYRNLIWRAEQRKECLL